MYTYNKQNSYKTVLQIKIQNGGPLLQSRWAAVCMVTSQQQNEKKTEKKTREMTLNLTSTLQQHR